MANSTKDGRGRNWATIVYPDSAPVDWLERVDRLHVPLFVSPLHDCDVNDDGDLKKPHYHVLIMYDGHKTENGMRDLFSSFGGVGCEFVQSIRGYARYLCHLDNPEKHQYCPENVKCFCGADYFSICSLAIDKYSAIREMMQFVRDNEIFSYSALCDYAAACRTDWFRILVDKSTMYMSKYINSCFWEKTNGVCQPPMRGGGDFPQAENTTV